MKKLNKKKIFALLLFFLGAIVLFTIIKLPFTSSKEYSMRIDIQYPDSSIRTLTCSSKLPNFSCSIPFTCETALIRGKYFARTTTYFSGSEISNSGSWVEILNCKND